ncbi:hypothetical protein GC163_17505 [bacterium]|nr:hypothetical protein [bacterium]
MLDLMIGGVIFGMFLTLITCMFLTGGMPPGKPIGVWGFIQSTSFFAAFVLGFCGVIALPMGLFCLLVKPRPILIVGVEGHLEAYWNRKKVQLPLAECRWKVGRIWTWDDAGAILHWQPRLIITWIREPPSSGKRPEAKTLSVGLTPAKYQEWLNYLEAQRVPPHDHRLAIAVMRDAFIGAIIGMGIGLVMAESIRLAFNAMIAGGIVVVCVLDGCLIGGIRKYARSGEIQRVKAFFLKYGKFAPPGFGLLFGLLALKIMSGMGFAVIIPAGILNGLLGAASLYAIQQEFQKRERASAEEQNDSAQEEELEGLV